MQFIDLSTQLEMMREKIDQRIKKVLDHGQFIMGPEVTELEERLADYVGVKHCISCANGTDALQISLMSKGIKRGDIVFTTAFSFFATAEAIELVGATPFFVDIDPITFNIDPDSLKEAIHAAEASYPGKLKAVIAVDLFGLPADYSTLSVICDESGLILIEDAAQGFGGAYKDKKAGSFGNIATTSFFPAKPLGCYGDGGAVFTNEEETAQIARSIRVHGKGTHKYENVRIGLNSRLDTIQAAILLQKLQSFPKELEHRQVIASQYSSLDSVVELPVVPEQFYSSWAQYTIKVAPKDRANLQRFLSKEGVPSMVYYPTALNKQIAFKHALSVDTPISFHMSHSVLSLPMSGWTPRENIAKTVKTIKDFYTKTTDC